MAPVPTGQALLLDLPGAQSGSEQHTGIIVNYRPFHPSHIILGVSLCTTCDSCGRALHIPILQMRKLRPRVTHMELRLKSSSDSALAALESAICCLLQQTAWRTGSLSSRGWDREAQEGCTGAVCQSTVCCLSDRQSHFTGTPSPYVPA